MDPECSLCCPGLTTILTIYALTGDDIRILSTEKPADLYFNVMAGALKYSGLLDWLSCLRPRNWSSRTAEVLVCIAIFSFEIIISVMGKA